ncbi:hypothetical protein ACWCWD_15980 [Streptomyces sp. NPDC001493]
MRGKPGRTTKADRAEGAVLSREAEPLAALVDGPWLVMGKDQRLSLFTRSEGRLSRWTQTRPAAAEWSGPEHFPTPRLSHLSLVQGADGFVRFVGRRISADGASADVVQAIQYQTGRPLAEWKTVGNPHRDPGSARRAGAPVAAVSDSGRVRVFLSNAGGGVSMRAEGAKGAWGPWDDLKGSDATNGMVVVGMASGRAELLVPGVGSAMRWQQSGPDGDMVRGLDLQISVAPGSACGLETAPDRITYYWADADTGTLFAHRPGSWVVPLGGVRAVGRVAALRTWLDGYDCTVLAHGTPDGHIMLAACGTENEGGGLWWSPTGDKATGSPALACDAAGRVVLVTAGEDGVLRVARQSDEPGLAMGPSVRI